MESFFCILSWVLTALLFLFFFLLAFFSNILRDKIDNPAAFMANAALMPKYAGKSFDKIPRPFSLASTQFAIWTVIIASIYLHHLLCIKGCNLSIETSTTTLALLGISAGTTGLASAIDKNAIRQNNIIPRHQNQPSQGFLFDILSDENGVSIHRFQNVVWTVVAITIYLHKSTSGVCAWAELDGTLLTLSGISNAAYLGLKLNENN